MAFKQEVNVSLLMTIGIVSGILLLVIVIGTQAWYQSEEMDEVAVKADEAAARALSPDSPTVTFAELKQGQELALDAKPHWVDDKKKDRVAVPIGQAITYLANHGGKLP
ncbi:MAG: hypothetical protein ABSB42_05745 [Tepidisphaeraceae bacterium]|jgi:hypothetical protein